MSQIAVRLPEPLLEALDALVEEQGYESRAAAVRAAVEELLRSEDRRRVDRLIVDGYRRTPPTRGEDASALASLRDAILAEPW